MESIVTTLGQSRQVLTDHGRELLTSTREASLTLVRQTRRAGGAFVEETRQASGGFVEATVGASTTFASSLGEEAEAMSGELRHGGTKLLSAFVPRNMERTLLRSLHGAMTEATRRVETRLDTLALPEHVVDGLPLPGYDTLTAKQVVARLGELNDVQVGSIYQHEQENKSRATVLRAAEARLAN